MARNPLFISYSRQDTAFAHRLADDLRTAGYSVWIDVSGIRGGQEWVREIDQAIRECDLFVVIVSPNSMASEWVRKETLFAQAFAKPLVPVLWREAELPVHLIDIQYVDFQGDYDAALRDLSEVLEQRRPRVMDTPRRFAHSQLDSLRRLPLWVRVMLLLVAIGLAVAIVRLLLASPPPVAQQMIQATAANGLVVDNTDLGFVIDDGEWGTCPDGECGGVSYGVDFRFADPECAVCRARFEFDAVEDGDYDVWTWWPKGEDRATNTLFTLLSGTEVITVTVNQRDLGDAWYRLGALPLRAGQPGSVVVYGAATGYANADAIAVTPAGSGPPLVQTVPLAPTTAAGITTTLAAPSLEVD